jgi:hypothetical protein
MFLKNTNLKNWFKLPELISFIFISFLKIYFKFNIKILYLVSNTIIGYSFFIIFMFYGFCNSINCLIISNFSVLFVFYIIKNIIELWLLLKISVRTHW